MYKSFLFSLYPVLAIIILIFILIWLFKLKINFSLLNRQKYNLGLSFFLFVAACFPYWIIGLIPSFSDWSSRHLLLTIFGVSLFFTAVVFCFHSKFRIWVFSFLLSVFIYLNVYNYFEFYLDWQKQKQLVSLFKSNEVIKKSNLFFITDYTDNALDRNYRYYEWNGLLFYSFLNESKFGINADDYLVNDVEKYLLTENPDLVSFDSVFFLEQSKARDFSLNKQIVPAEIVISYKKRVPFLSEGFSFFPQYSIKVTSK